MQLKDVLQQFLNSEEWKDEIEHDDSDNTDFISTRYGIKGQTYDLQLTADQDRQVIRVLMVSPITMPGGRRTEAAIVVNGLNSRMGFGNLGINDDGAIYYRWAMDVEGATAAPQQFANMVAMAASAFDNIRCAALGAAAFSKQSGEEILKDYQEAVEAGAG
jgi:hypothetical protein